MKDVRARCFRGGRAGRGVPNGNLARFVPEWAEANGGHVRGRTLRLFGLAREGHAPQRRYKRHKGFPEQSVRLTGCDLQKFSLWKWEAGCCAMSRTDAR